MSKLLSHPFLLLLATTVLSSIFVPIITSRSNKLQIVQQERLRNARMVIDHSTEVNSKLSSLQTSLELFNKYVIPSRQSEDQRELREKMKELYSQFSEQAWWWHWELRENLRFLEIIDSKEYDRLGVDLASYTSNLERSTSTLGEFWTACLSNNYKHGQPHIDSVMIETRRRLLMSQTKRDSLVSRIIQTYILD